MKTSYEPEWTPERHEHSHDHEYSELAANVVRDAFVELIAAERMVENNRDRLRGLARKRPCDRDKKSSLWARAAQFRLEQVRRDLKWFDRRRTYPIWTYWVDLDADMMAQEYRGRATRLLDEVRELTGGVL